MSTIIYPTIGRRVWYWPSEAELHEHVASLGRTRTGAGFAVTRGQPCDAGIAFVHGDRMVNLTVADHHGFMHSRCSVTLLQEGDLEPPAGTAYAQWTHYQVGRAT